jgi:hypothetical protein
MMTSLHLTPSLDQLKRAVDLRERIESLTAELHQLIGGAAVTHLNGSANGGGRLSPEGRARIAAAQRLRWARFNAARGGRPKPTTRHLLSPGGRARISVAVKARWARYRQGKAKGALARQ